MPKKKPVVKKAPIKKTIDVHENCLVIENLGEVKEKVETLLNEKEYNPGVVQEDEAGLVFLEGEACMVIDGGYVPHEEATLIFQTRKVVREYLRLQKMLKSKK